MDENLYARLITAGRLEEEGHTLLLYRRTYIKMPWYEDYPQEKQEEKDILGTWTWKAIRAYTRIML